MNSESRSHAEKHDIEVMQLYEASSRKTPSFWKSCNLPNVWLIFRLNQAHSMHSILFACALDGICHMHSQKLRTENRRCLVSSKSADYDPEENDPVFPYPAIRSSASSAAARTFPSASSERAGTAALDGICHMLPPKKIKTSTEYRRWVVSSVCYETKDD